MNEATTLILRALEEARDILPAGKQSLLAIAARALNPTALMTKEGIAQTLGYHPSLVVAILVTADLAGDTSARRALGQTLFERLPPQGQRAQLTPRGQLAVALFCLEQLRPLGAAFAGLIEATVELARQAFDGQAPDRTRLEVLEAKAGEFQRTKIVLVEKGSKSKFGIPTEEAIRRRGSQAVRALLQSFSDGCQNPHLCPTVAGETAGALVHAIGLEAAATFCVDLAEAINGLPPDQALRRPGNGS